MHTEQRNLLKERIPHGTAMFPMKVHTCKTDVCCRERLVCHWHEEMEILVVTNGTADFHIDTNIYHVTVGDVLFIDSNHLHSATTDCHTPFDFFAVVFSPAFLNNSLSDCIQQRYVSPVLNGEVRFPAYIHPRSKWEQSLFTLLTDIKEIYLEHTAAYELLIKAKLYEVWYQFYIHADSAKQTENDYRVCRMKQMLQYIQSRYNQQITLTELATTFQLSKEQLCRFFKSTVKMTVVEYIHFYRITQSGTLLRQTDKGIGEIAGMVGFNNISYYNKIFRRYMHCSPTEFRKSSQLG